MLARYLDAGSQVVDVGAFGLEQFGHDEFLASRKASLLGTLLRLAATHTERLALLTLQLLLETGVALSVAAARRLALQSHVETVEYDVMSLRSDDVRRSLTSCVKPSALSSRLRYASMRSPNSL